MSVILYVMGYLNIVTQHQWLMVSCCSDVEDDENTEARVRGIKYNV